MIPIFTEAGTTVPPAILVFGLNPRCEYDEVYVAFTQMVSRHVAFALLGVTVRFSFPPSSLLSHSGR